MRERGHFLLRLAEGLGTIRLRETVVLPALADMQHECGEARSDGGRRWAVARGYWSIISGSIFYAAFQPARYVREDWGSLSAPGPRLLRQAWPPTAIAAVLFLGIAVSIWPNEKRLGNDVMALLLPSLVLSVAPMALAVGVGWALACDRSGSRAVVAVGLLLAVFSFAFFDVVVTKANQAYRVASYQAITGRSETLRKGSREMTFRELSGAVALGPAESCPRPPAGGCSCAEEASPTFFLTEWHHRLSMPAFGFSFVLFAAFLSRFGRRLVVILGLWLTLPTAALLMRFAEKHSTQGDIPVFLAAWCAHLVPLTFAAVLHLGMRRRNANHAAVAI